MSKFVVTATHIINYETTIEAESFAQAHRIADALITEDFHAVGGEFTVDYIADADE